VPCYGAGPIFLGLASSGDGDCVPIGGCGDNGCEISDRGDGWTEESCSQLCFEDINCDLWESPCVWTTVGTSDIQHDRDVDSLFTYCQRIDPGQPNYCDPGNCTSAGVPRYKYEVTNWNEQGSWQNPLYKELPGEYNDYPLYINSSRTSICLGTPFGPPLEWYNFSPQGAWLAWFYKGGNKESGFDDTYTPGTVGNNFDYIEPSVYPGFLSPGWVSEFKTRYNAQTWKLIKNADTKTCSCFWDYPGQLVPGEFNGKGELINVSGADAEYLLETFGNDTYWVNASGGAGTIWVANSLLHLMSDPAQTPTSGDFGLARRNGTTDWGGEYDPADDLTWVTYRVKHIGLGTLSQAPFVFRLQISSTRQLVLNHSTDGLYVLDRNRGVWLEIGTNVNFLDCGSGSTPIGTWQEWTFRVSLTGHADQASETMDVWLDGYKIGDDIGWKETTGSTNPGQVIFQQSGNNVFGYSIVEFITVGESMSTKHL
jgi:hypothetical protein